MTNKVFDFARCKPVKPDDTCKGCNRWAEMPGQTWPLNYVLYVTENSQDKHCIHLTINELKVRG